MSRALARAVWALGVVACARGGDAPRRAPEAVPGVAVAPVASRSRAGGTASGAATVIPPAGEEAAAPCGKTPCRIFADERSAFAAVLERRPRVLGIGEAHALAGARVESATRRFTRELLPLLRGRATDLVVEVLLPNPRCHAATKAAREEQRAVTDRQAPTDQSDFVALGEAARALGIRPFALEPTCADLARIGRGGEDAIAASLDAVTRLTREKITALVAERGGPDAASLVVAYGGAMHNDVAPARARAAWSYGPETSALTKGRYVELDLIVPEFVKRTPAWESLPWYADFDAAAHPREVTLFQPLEAAYALIFPATP